MKRELKKPKILLGLLVTLVLVLSLAMAAPALASSVQLAKDVTPKNPNKYYLGDTIHYVINVTNPNGNEATNYLDLVDDILPDGSHVTLAANVTQLPDTSNIYYQDYVVDENDLVFSSGRWRVINTVHVTGIDSNFEIIDSTTEKNSIILRPEISIDKTVDFNGDHVFHNQESNAPGQNATWKVVVTNTGFDPVYNITVNDTNLHGFGAPFNLAVNASMTFTYNTTIYANTVNTAGAEGVDELGNPVGPVYDSAQVTVGTAPVGGSAFPVDKARLLAPWVGLALGCAAVATVLVLRRRRQA